MTVAYGVASCTLYYNIYIAICHDREVGVFIVADLHSYRLYCHMTHNNFAVLVDTQSLIRNMAIYKMILHNILNVLFFFLYFIIV